MVKRSVTEMSAMAAIVSFLVVGAMVLGLVLWVGLRDRDALEEPGNRRSSPEIAEILTGREPATRPMAVVEVDWPDFSEEAEEAVSSYAIILEENEVFVTNEPEAPVSPTTTAPPPLPPPPPAPAPAPSEIRAVVCGPFAGECEKAMRVVECESTFDPTEVGGAGERGLFQIHPVHRERIAAMGFTWDDMFDPAANTAVAHAIRTEQGWGPWTCQ